MRHKIFLLAVMLSLLAAGTSYAATSYETEVINNVGIGDISIGLEEFELDESGIEGLSDYMVTLDSNQWVKVGDYYYYIVPVDKDVSIDFVKEVRIPTEWDESYADKSFSIVVTADAVQADNFTPDFKSDDPWFGTVIETCVHTSYTSVQAEDEAFSVVFEGGAEGLVRTGDDFFANWGELMPGDTVCMPYQIRRQNGSSLRFQRVHPEGTPVPAAVPVSKEK